MTLLYYGSNSSRGAMHPPPLLLPHGLIHHRHAHHNTLLLLPPRRWRSSYAKGPSSSLFLARASNQQPQNPTSSSSSLSPPPPSPSPLLSSSSSSTTASSAAESPPADSSQRSRPIPGGLSDLLSIPRSIWKQLFTPLNNFGFGQRSVWEGGVGMFIVSGAVLFSLTVAWLKGYQIRSRSQKYHAIIEFTKANGICVGTPVRMRGVDIGNVVTVSPSLESIDVVVQIFDANVVVPKDSLVEVNQSGLLMDTLIDITPPRKLRLPSVGPLDPYCGEEGAIVCDRQRIKGEQGVNLDELIGIFTRLAKEVDEIGVGEIYSLAERVGKVVEDAKPLLEKVTSLIGNVEPLLNDVQNGGLVKEVELLTKALNEAMIDVKTLNESVLTPDNRQQLQQSISTLTKTLKNIESISGDVSSITGDTTTRHNLKNLIESLTRLLGK